ncbi:MAG: sulfite exporter TauE/SafE family protein [Thiotrichales bacterium]|nr:sulfite exporter TauE/SafE family protein [Thiotrichales bacterium]
MPAVITEITILIYFCLGAVAGLTGGLMGLGGGIVIVPALVYMFLQQGLPAAHLMQMAVATSLTTIVFTSVASAWSHHQKGAVMWPQVRILVPGIVVGAIIGALIANKLPSEILKRAFGLFEILVALQIGFGINPKAERRLPGTAGMLISGTGIGSLSTILGIGGGTLTVPFLMWCNIDIRKAVGTSSACGFPIAVAGALSMVLIGMQQDGLAENTLGYLYWPAAILIVLSSMLFAPLGAKLAHILNVSVLKKIFAVVLFLIGTRMVI